MTYLKELKSIWTSQLLKEPDASNGIGRHVAGEQVGQVGHWGDVSDAVLAQVQVLNVLVLLQLVLKVFNRRVCLLKGQRRKRIRASICTNEKNQLLGIVNEIKMQVANHSVEIASRDTEIKRLNGLIQQLVGGNQQSTTEEE